jgi:hypothetical protein
MAAWRGFTIERNNHAEFAKPRSRRLDSAAGALTIALDAKTTSEFIKLHQ